MKFIIAAGVDGVGKSSLLGVLKCYYTHYLETTLDENWIECFFQHVRAKGYTVRLCYIGLNSAEESVKRIQNRVAMGGHNIDQADVNRRFAKRFDDLAKILPYSDEAVFYDNQSGFTAVGEYANGRIIEKGEKTPDWLSALANKVNR